ncbi:hypothetical protein FRC06_006914, partial [Ceratobasidium sp. 370]
MSTTQHTHPATRSHTRHLLKTYRDLYDALPEAPPPLPTPSTVPTVSLPTARARFHFSNFEMLVDSFGRFHTYLSKPLTIPDSNATLEDFTDLDLALDAATDTPPSTSIQNAIAPCPNLSTYYLLRWFWKRSKNLITSREELVNEVLLQQQLNPSDLAGVDLRAIDKSLASAASHALQGAEQFSTADGWRARSVPVQVPVSQKASSQHSGTSHRVMVSGLHSRAILQGIRKGFSQNNRTQFHYEPFHLSWIPPGEPKSKAQMPMGEIYNSLAMLDAHKEIQKLKISDEKCTLPRVVAAIMFGSDATQLGAFSTKKAWMMYMWLGNLIPLKLAHKMGTRSDMQAGANKPRRDNIPRQKLVRQARDIIYTQHKAVDNAEVEHLLRPQSFVPTENAFSKRLLPFKFNFFKMFVVDLLHEIELG